MTIRWMIRRDMPSVLAIEQVSFEYPMNETEIITLLRRRDTIGMVYEDGDEILGYMIYSLGRKYIEVDTFAVHPNHRMRGVGREMFDKLASKLALQRRNRIELLISETNLGGLNFFKKLGMRAANLVHQPWENHGCNHDGISMVFRVREAVEA
jgi:[ribosomal protein S18]-alanine N-acetyltransferase